MEQQPATALFVAEDDEVRTRPQVCPGVFTAEADAVEKGAQRGLAVAHERPLGIGVDFAMETRDLMRGCVGQGQIGPWRT